MAIDGLKNFLPPSQTSTTDLMDYKVYDAIRELQRKVQELVGYSGSLAASIEQQQNLIDGMNARIADLENRVTALENQP